MAKMKKKNKSMKIIKLCINIFMPIDFKFKGGEKHFMITIKTIFMRKQLKTTQFNSFFFLLAQQFSVAFIEFLGISK